MLLCSASEPGYPAGNLYSLLQKLERKRDRGFRKAQQIEIATPLQERHTNEYMRYVSSPALLLIEKKLYFFKLHK